jgi:uncharacterized membrane protein
MAEGDIDSVLGIGSAHESPAATGSELVVRAMERYRDAYRTAQVITRVGGVIKALGIALAILMFLGGLVIGMNILGHDDTLQLISLGVVGVSAIVTGVIIYMCGVIVSAQGQQLKATLDSAVHTSPYLDLDAKARAMSL